MFFPKMGDNIAARLPNTLIASAYDTELLMMPVNVFDVDPGGQM